MQLDSIMVRAYSPADVRRLRRAGGEVWQEHGQTTAGAVRWAYALVKIPAAVAIRLQLVTPGAEMVECADTESRLPDAYAPGKQRMRQRKGA